LSFRRPSALALEIAVVLAVKAVALTIIWWAFFSEPVAPSMKLEPAAVDRQLLSTNLGFDGVPTAGVGAHRSHGKCADRNEGARGPGAAGESDLALRAGAQRWPPRAPPAQVNADGSLAQFGGALHRCDLSPPPRD